MRYISLTTALLLVGCGQTATDPCAGRKAGDLVVTEVMIDPDGTDTGNEWFEVYNTTDATIELKGLTLFKREGSTAARTHLVRAGAVAPRGYAVFGDVRSGPNPAWVTYAYGDDLSALSSAGGTVGIRCGTALILDEATWTRPPKAGRSRALTGLGTPTATANDDEANWCDTPAELTYSTGNAGSPGLANPLCQPEVSSATCIEGGVARAIVEPAPGDLVITEVMSSPSAPDSTGEWFEMYAVRAVDLNGLRVAAGGSTTTSPLNVPSADCARVDAGSYVLVARSDQSSNNGGLPAVDALTTLTLATTNTQLTLQLRDGGLVDRATYPAPATNRSHQLRPPLLDATANDDSANYCVAQVRFGSDGGGDYGTPKVANDCQTAGGSDAGADAGSDGGLLMPGQCLDSNGTARAIVKPSPGDLVVTEFMPDPIAVDDTMAEWVEVLVRADVDLNGLQLADSQPAWQTVVSTTACRRATAGTRLLFARAPSLGLLDGGSVAAAGTFTFSLNNTGGDTVRVGIDGAELDAWVYTTVTVGASIQLNGSLMMPTPADNDVAANTCRASSVAPYQSTVLGSDRGTPGEPNPACP
jgi:hypothetical protein